MASLYVLSVQPYSGKSAVVLGIALELRSRGLSIGYMKPVGVDPDEVGGRPVDSDALFMQKTLNLPNPPETICPVLFTADLEEAAMAGELPTLRPKVEESFKEISEGKDLTILESAGGLATGLLLDLAPRQVVSMTDSKVLLVLRGDARMPAEDVLLVQEVLQGKLAGVVINGAPRDLLGRITQEFTPFLERQGMRLFGVLHEDRLLTAISVEELAIMVQGQIICCQDRKDELVQSFVVGGMGGQAAYRHLLRYKDMALITGFDRTDILMVALDTPTTKALIISGNLQPEASVMTRAKSQGIPIILSPADTTQTVAAVDDAWGNIRLSRPRPQQLDRLLEIVRQEFDFPALMRTLGL